MKIEALDWPGGTHDFALPLGQIRSVQNACDAGPMQVYHALRTGTWRVEMLEAILRHGLAGAGMDSIHAKELVARTMDARPLGEFVYPAMLIIGAALVGPGDDPAGELAGETSPPESSPSVPSTEAEQKPDSPPETSTP